MIECDFCSSTDVVFLYSTPTFAMLPGGMAAPPPWTADAKSGPGWVACRPCRDIVENMLYVGESWDAVIASLTARFEETHPGVELFPPARVVLADVFRQFLRHRPGPPAELTPDQIHELGPAAERWREVVERARRSL